MIATDKSALVLFSGGQDSTLCLAISLERYDHVETIGFDYGQRHHVELTCLEDIRQIFKKDFQQWGAKLGGHTQLSLPGLQEISETSLTREQEIFLSKEGLPSTFVPGRNLLFFTYAAALAYRHGIDVLVGGMCETDYSGYPDCRHESLVALNNSLNLGMSQHFQIETPLMWKSKAQSWEMAHRLGGEEFVKLIIEKTHSCYLGDRKNRHSWGYGCGECPACQLRSAGFEEWQECSK